VRCRRRSAACSRRGSTPCPRKKRSLLLDAAVVGKTFWRGALAGGDGRTGSPSCSEHSSDGDLIVRDTGSIIEGDQQFSFKHVLIRDVAYELLPRAERRERHARVAEYFEESTAEIGEAAAALARHWRDAGEGDRSFGYFLRAAEQAERGWAKDQAAILYREALDLVPEDDDRLRTFAAGSRSRARRPCTSRTPAC
jgi:hypothetical protein